MQRRRVICGLARLIRQVGISLALPFAAAAQEQPRSVPFQAQRGHVMVPARLNGTNSVSLMLDTGYGITMIHPDLAEQLGLRRVGKISIVGIAGEEDAAQYEGATFDFGGAVYSPRRVAALPSERERRRRRDGILGAGFFRRFVVEIDTPAKLIRLHEPDAFQYAGKGTIVPLSFKRDTPIIDAAIQLADGKTVPGRFEIDTGCTGGLCLGSDFVRENGMLEKLDSARASTRSGVGGGVRSKSGTVPKLQIANISIANPSTELFVEGSPVDHGLAGHVGWEALERFRVILDYKRKQMILEPLAP